MVHPFGELMPLRKLKNWWNARTPAPVNVACTADCPLASCLVGSFATVLGVSCPALDANRLRTLGVYEGAVVSIVDRRSGILLDVCGTRLALNDAIAASILVRPVAA
jgi:Fe2+ transport system protein FeoA